VRVPYTLTIYHVDEDDATTRFDREIKGDFNVFHVPPGQQRRSALIIDATYYPRFTLDLGDPEVIGIGGRSFPHGWTDLGEEYRRTELNNDEMWKLFRRLVWEPSRPAAVEVAVTAAVRREPGAIVVPLVVQGTNSSGSNVSGTAQVTVFGNGNQVWLTGYQAQSGVGTELRLPLIAAGNYAVQAQMGSVTAFCPLTIP